MQQSLGNNAWAQGVVMVPPIESIFDSVANDSDKSWVVPDNELWLLNWAHAILISTATVGNRELCINVLDELGNLLIDIPSSAVQAASLTNHYAFYQGIFRETAFAANAIQVPIPKDLYLRAGYTLRVYDRAAIAPAADDMTVSFQIQKYLIQGAG